MDPEISSTDRLLEIESLRRELNSLTQTNKKLERTQILHTQAEEFGSLGHWEWDVLEERFITCSEQYAKIFGKTVTQMFEEITCCEQAQNLVCDEDRQRFKKTIELACQNNQRWDIEFFAFSAGQQVYLKEIGEPMLDEYGQVIKTVGTVQDITRHKLVEKAFEQQNAILLDLRDKFSKAERTTKSCHWETDDQLKTVTHKSANSLILFGGQPLDGTADINCFEKNIVLEDRLEIRKVFDSLQINPRPFEIEFRYQRADGLQIWVREVGEPIFNNAGKVCGFRGTQQDITAEKEKEFALSQATEAALKANRELVFQKSALDQHAIVSITDNADNITYANDRFCSISGYDREELLGKNHKMIRSDGHADRFYEEMWGIISSGHTWHGEIKETSKTGIDYWTKATIVPTLNDKGEPFQYIGIRTEITERKQAEEKLKHIAHNDLLTNLPNRVLLADRLSQAMTQCQRRNKCLAVAFLDLDGFKAINDTHGHIKGDELLVVLSKRIKEALREGDTLARIGGDEFIAVITDLENTEDCKPVLNRLLRAASEPVTVADTKMHVSASIGVTLYPQDGVEADQLTRHADQAMYIAKQAGKNRYHLFDTDQNNAIKVQREEINHIRSALKNNEFVLHYQPKVNMNTAEVIGVEALIRWQHPQRGLVQPLDFLPAIEGRSVSVTLGEWVIKSALLQINQWRSMGINLPISVNISVYQLQQDNFVTRLAALLAAHPEVKPHYLELEILETTVLSDVNQVLETMNSCHELGVRFALDDFGTGYSSLTHLRRLPAYLIKIDQSFVRDMLEDADDSAIVEGVVNLAKIFQRKVIAEGVETCAHADALIRLGCELAQGYGIARPMPQADIPQWVTSWQTEPTWQA